MELYSPWVLLLFLLLPILVIFRLRRGWAAAIKFPSLNDIRRCPVSLRQRLRPILNAIRFACIGLLIVALVVQMEQMVL